MSMEITHYKIGADHYLKFEQNGELITTLIIDRNESREVVAKNLFLAANSIAGKIMKFEDVL